MVDRPTLAAIAAAHASVRDIEEVLRHLVETLLHQERHEGLDALGFRLRGQDPLTVFLAPLGLIAGQPVRFGPAKSHRGTRMALNHAYAIRCNSLAGMSDRDAAESQVDHPVERRRHPAPQGPADARVNLMIADDVGLGKTIEGGLILNELIIRRRINRVLILTLASLRIQWRDEMWAKFSLPLDVIDRDATQKLRRSVGVDANPGRSCSRIISSYHYLRQPDVLEQFHSACGTPEGSPRLLWDLLTVEQVRNLMPASFGEDSQLCKTLRTIMPHFEHRLSSPQLAQRLHPLLHRPSRAARSGSIQPNG